MASNSECLHNRSNTVPRGYDSLRRAMGTFWETSSRGSWVADVQHYIDTFVDTTELDLGDGGRITYAMIEGQVAVSPFALLAMDATTLSSTYCVYLDAGSLSPASYILPRVRAYVSAGARNISILVSGQSDLLIFVPSLMKEVRDNNWGGDVHHITVTLWVDLHHPDVFALVTRPDIQALCYGDRESLCLGILVPCFLKQFVRPDDWKTHGPLDMFAAGGADFYAPPPPPPPATSPDQKEEQEMKHPPQDRDTYWVGGNSVETARPIRNKQGSSTLPLHSHPELVRRLPQNRSDKRKPTKSFSGENDGTHGVTVTRKPSQLLQKATTASQQVINTPEDPPKMETLNLEQQASGGLPKHKQQPGMFSELIPHRLCIWSTVSFGAAARSSALSLYRKYGKLYERSYRTLVQNGPGSTAHVAAFLKHLVRQSVSSKLQVRVLDRDALFEQCQARPPLPGPHYSERTQSARHQMQPPMDQIKQTPYYRGQFRADSQSVDSVSRVVVPSHCGEAPMLLADQEEIVVVSTFVVYPNVLSNRDDYTNSLVLAKQIGDAALRTLKANVRLGDQFNHPSVDTQQVSATAVHRSEDRLRAPSNDSMSHYSTERISSASQFRGIADGKIDSIEGSSDTSRLDKNVRPLIRWQTIVGVIGVSSALSRMDFPNTPVVDRETIAHLTTPLLPFVYPLAGTLVSHLWDVSEGVWTFQSPIRYIGDSRLSPSSSSSLAPGYDLSENNGNPYLLDSKSRSKETNGSSDQTTSLDTSYGSHQTQNDKACLIPLMEQSFRDWSAGRHLDSDISVADQSRRYMLEYLSQSNQESICSHLGLLLRAVSSYFLSPTNIRIGISSWDLTPLQAYSDERSHRYHRSRGEGSIRDRRETVFDLISDNLNTGCVVILPEIYPFSLRGQLGYTPTTLPGGAFAAIPISPSQNSGNNPQKSVISISDQELLSPNNRVNDHRWDHRVVGVSASDHHRFRDTDSKLDDTDRLVDTNNIGARLRDLKEHGKPSKSMWSHMASKLFGKHKSKPEAEVTTVGAATSDQQATQQPPASGGGGSGTASSLAGSVSGKVIDSILIRASEALDKAMDGFEKTYISRNKGVPGGLAWQRL